MSVSTPPALSARPGFLSTQLIGEALQIEDPVEGTWRPGDVVIYGITMRSPSRSQQWLIRIKVDSYPAEPARDPARVLLEVEVFDDRGKVQDSAQVLASAAEFEHGPYPGCLVGTKDNWKETVEGDRVSLSWGLTAEEAETVDRSLTALKAFFGLASSTLRPIVDTVVARPPMKEVLLHGGIIHLTVHWYMIGVAEIVAEFPEIPDRVCSFGFEVDAYDAPALRGRLFVTDSRPPFLPGGGIVAIEASHPTDPASTVSVRLLAANRSPVNGVLK